MLVLAAQHNKITSFPSDLHCLLLRVFNLNGNRYNQDSIGSVPVSLDKAS